MQVQGMTLLCLACRHIGGISATQRKEQLKARLKKPRKENRGGYGYCLVKQVVDTAIR